MWHYQDALLRRRTLLTHFPSSSAGYHRHEELFDESSVARKKRKREPAMSETSSSNSGVSFNEAVDSDLWKLHEFVDTSSISLKDWEMEETCLSPEVLSITRTKSEMELLCDESWTDIQELFGL